MQRLIMRPLWLFVSPNVRRICKRSYQHDNGGPCVQMFGLALSRLAAIIIFYFTLLTLHFVTLRPETRTVATGVSGSKLV